MESEDVILSERNKSDPERQTSDGCYHKWEIGTGWSMGKMSQIRGGSSGVLWQDGMNIV
jgi:hypothetical protein